MHEVFGRLEPKPVDGDFELSAEPLQAARDKVAEGFDREFGGIGSAPKFPHPENLDRLLRHWRATANDAKPDVEALFMVNWQEDEEAYCTAAEDFQDAKRVCDALDIPLHRADFSAEYRERVETYFRVLAERARKKK